MSTFNCVDCGIDTSGNEYYMVFDEVWKISGMKEYDGMLCIGCLEARIGRKLTKDDFPDYPINNVSMKGNRISKRLKNRLLN